MEKYAAIILAAGKGTRMGGEEGSEIPKVMYEICSQPIIRHSVTLTEKAGIKKIILVVGYKKELIEDYFKDEVEYAVQDQQLGTGHAVACAKSVVEGQAESVIVFYGDNPLYEPETIQNLIALYEKEKPTVAMLSVHFDDPMFWAFGRIVRDEVGEVVGIVEHKDCDEEQLKITECNPGFYIFDADWLWENISRLKTENVQHELYLTDMIHLAREQNKRIIAMPVPEESEALGINTPEQLKEAGLILASRQ